MQDSKLRSRLKAQLTKFSSELCGELSRPLEKFVAQMLFGIQASQDIKLSNIQCAQPSAGLRIAMVDRANLSHPMEN